MSINTDLNVNPYFDDFDEEKQFVRVLFKPSRSVQARELTQLQSILQNQIERFGSNIYQEGTVINGVNLKTIQDLFYVKLDDDLSGLGDLGLLDFVPRKSTSEEAAAADNVSEGDILLHEVRGLSSGLKAQIISVASGFETRAPDLKTFFVKYIGTTTGDSSSFSQFEAGEELEIYSPFGVKIASITTTSFTNHVGRAFGVEIDDGIIYQKGHFIYVQPQNLIVSKYSQTPPDLSIGFTIQEDIITSNQDQSLLDNAQGFNNLNAPGADRLRLSPLLVSYAKGEEPSEFFSLVKYRRGQAIRIRDITEFNSVAKELARRTYDESGHYVVDGMKLGIETLDEIVGGQAVKNQYVTVDPGKAYVRGFYVKTNSKTYLPLPNLSIDDARTVQNQGISTSFGNYFEISQSTVNDKFQLDGTEYDVYNDTTVIGRTSIKGLEKGKLYVYNLRKKAGQEGTAITKIGNTPVSSGVLKSNIGRMLFRVGDIGVSSLSDVTITRRARRTFSASTPTTTIAIPFTGTTSPINNSNILVLDGVDSVINVSTVTQGDFNGVNSLILTLASSVTPSSTVVYYDESVVAPSADLMNDTRGKVLTSLIGSPTLSASENKRANLGHPNVYKLDGVFVYNAGSGVRIREVTNKFNLAMNQKDGYHGYSYIELKRGENITFNQGEVLLVEYRALQRVATFGGGYLTADSYQNFDFGQLPPYSASDGVAYDLAGCIDFRPTVKTTISHYSINSGDAGTPTAPNYDKVYRYVASDLVSENQFQSQAMIMPANNAQTTADVDYFLPRKDTVAINAYGEFELILGRPDFTPSAPQVVDELNLGSVLQVTNIYSNSALSAPSISRRAVHRYTMRDIDQINKRIDRLTEIASLTLLENSSRDLLITDANGNNRFKNGILVDAFKDLNIANVNSAEFKASLDKAKQRLQPAIREFPIYLKRGGIESDSLNVDYFKDVITKANTGQTDIAVEQPLGTNFRNCASNFWYFKGKGGIWPDFDSGVDPIPGPPITAEIDLASPIIDLVDTLQAGRFIPTTGEEITDEVLGTRDVGNWRQEGNWRVTDTIDTVRVNTFDLDMSQTSLTPPRRVGDFVTDLSFNRYIETKDIKILVQGLKPNTPHKIYFEQDDVMQHVAQGTMPQPNANGLLEIDDVQVLGAFGGETRFGTQVLITDDLGKLSAVFRIPARTYFIGDSTLEISDALSYDNIESAGTSYASFTYRAYNLDYTLSELNTTTRVVDFQIFPGSTSTEVAGDVRRVWNPPPPPPQDNDGGPDGGPDPDADPIAQTFFTKNTMAEGASYMFVESVDVFFRTKDENLGFTFEIRETDNGYPSRRTLPFGSIHVDSKATDANGNVFDVVRTSVDGSLATNIRFPNPVRLSLDSEYCFVIIPDAANPNYNIFTSKVGGNDLISGSAAYQDWGDGVLFTSTNNSAWRSYQDEDIKFRINRYNFTTETSYINLFADDMEFFEINPANSTGEFITNELAYTLKQSTPTLVMTILNDGSTAGNERRKLTTGTNITFPISEGEYILLEQSSVKKLVQVVSIEAQANANVVTVKQPLPSGFTNANIDVYETRAGIVSYFDRFREDQLHLRKSTAKLGNVFDTGDVVIGDQSGSTATISDVMNIPVSYMQGLIIKSDTLRTSSYADLYDGNTLHRSLPTDKNTYIQDRPRVVESVSNVYNPVKVDTSDFDFNVRVTMENNGYRPITTILDDSISQIRAYQFEITQEPQTSSGYLSKTVVLNDDIWAEGLKVFATLHRPRGTDVVAYARFKYRDNEDDFSDWIELNNLNSSVYTSSSSVLDYKEYEYELDTASEKEYVAFQIRFAMTTTDNQIGEINVSPYIKDYRAIAVT